MVINVLVGNTVTNILWREYGNRTVTEQFCYKSVGDTFVRQVWGNLFKVLWYVWLDGVEYCYKYRGGTVWFDLVLWHINHCILFNAKSSLYIYIKYIWYGLVGFYGISTIVGYLMRNPLHTCILNIYDLVWLGLWHINHCRLFNAKYSLYIYI